MSVRQIGAMLIFVGLATSFLYNMSLYPGYPGTVHMSPEEIEEVSTTFVHFIIPAVGQMVALLGCILVFVDEPHEEGGTHEA